MTMIPLRQSQQEMDILTQASELPQRLLVALERYAYEQMDVKKLAIARYMQGDVYRNSLFIQVEEVVHGPDIAQSFHLRNMQNVIGSLCDGSHALVYAVCSRPPSLQLLMGVRALPHSTLPPADYINVLRRNLRANYPGIVLSPEPLSREQCDDILLKPLTRKHLAAITGIPSLKSADGAFMQSVDRLVDALRGESYTLLVIAEPIPDARILGMIDILRSLSADIHGLVRQSVSVSRNTSQTTSNTIGSSMGFSLGAALAPFFAPSITQTLSKTFGSTTGAGASVTQERINKNAQFCEQVLEQLLGRLQNGRNSGFWNTGAYIVSDDRNAFLRAQSIARSLYAGEHTYFEPLRIIDLTEARDKTNAQETLKHLWNIRLGDNQLYHPLGDEYRHFSTPLTTEELSILVSLPHREVPGLKVSPTVDFNLNPDNAGQGDFELGFLLYREEVLKTRVKISAKNLTRHTFVTGLTGSGKTNTCLALLANAYRNRGLNFMVIDPAKTEYRFLLNAEGVGERLLVFTLGEETLTPFRLNPFEFVRGFPLLAHIDLIKAIFNAAFPMYASMPYLLEKAMLAIYEERGWDIATSTNRFVDVNDPAVDYTLYLPQLSDLYAKIDDVVATEGYDTRLRLDITAALKARLGSLLRGGKGLMLNTQRSIPMSELLKRPVVLELRRIGDEDEKAFLMALIFARLYEEVQQNPPGSDLRHVTLIEEAHRLLRNIPIVASVESANPRGKAIEMFTDMMAEMRTYGEGFIIVDQMPGKLVSDVIKGSNLKIIHRLLAQDDRQAVGSAMGLTPAQVDYLPRLTVGKAVVHSEELGDACLVLIDPVEDVLKDKLSDVPAQLRETNFVQQMRAHARAFYSTLPISIAPDILRPGCEDCPCRCWFGRRFQIEGHPSVQALNERLRRVHEKKLTLDEIVTLAIADNETEIAPHLRYLMAYCLLTQSNANPNMLAACRKDVLKRIWGR